MNKISWLADILIINVLITRDTRVDRVTPRVDRSETTNSA
jgi:hypothetical protein